MQKKVWQERAKDGGVIPVTGFPRVDGGLGVIPSKRIGSVQVEEVDVLATFIVVVVVLMP